MNMGCDPRRVQDAVLDQSRGNAHENEHLQRVRRLDPRKDFGKSSKPSARNF